MARPHLPPSNRSVHLTGESYANSATFRLPRGIFGDSVEAAWTVRNTGNGRTEPDDWFDTVFLSEDDTLDFDFIGGAGIRQRC